MQPRVSSISLGERKSTRKHRLLNKCVWLKIWLVVKKSTKKRKHERRSTNLQSAHLAATKKQLNAARKQKYRLRCQAEVENEILKKCNFLSFLTIKSLNA